MADTSDLLEGELPESDGMIAPPDGDFDDGAPGGSGMPPGGPGGPAGPAGGLPVTSERDSSPFRGNMPFVNVPLHPAIFNIALLDMQTRAGRHEYQGMSTSEMLAHFLLKLALGYHEAQLRGDKYDGLLQSIGDAQLRVMRRAIMQAADEIRQSGREADIATLVDRGIATRERLEEVLGQVPADVIP